MEVKLSINQHNNLRVNDISLIKDKVTIIMLNQSPLILWMKRVKTQEL
jgi:hypothetical protein